MQTLRPEDPAQVGGHRLLARLGEGGMGVVYLGRSPGGRLVAVKLILSHFRRDTRYRARFRREVAAVRAVNGAFTAALVDADTEAELPWLAMEYLPGLSLRQAVSAHGALPPTAVRLLAAAMAEALAGIHAVGLTHRDLKPANVLLTRSGPRLIDFGIARPLDATAITLRGSLLGTPGFMSPEQASGRSAEQPGDVFSLGAVLAFAATGREPFAAADRAATLERVRLARADLDDVADRRLRSLTAACLRREPDRRPTAAAVLKRLGEPTASVYGTSWLPVPLAEAIDAHANRVERPPPSPSPSAALVAPDEVTAPSTELTGLSTGGAGTRPGRRQLLLAALAALPVTGGAAVGLMETLAPTGDGRTAALRPSGSAAKSSPSRESATRSPAGGRPAVAERQWRAQIITQEDMDEDAERVRGLQLAGAGGMLIAWNGGTVRGVRPETGKRIWSRKADTRQDHVAIGPDAVYVFDARKGDDTSDYTLRALHPDTGATRWTRSVPFFPWAIAATGSMVYVAEGNDVHALDGADGRQRWTAGATATGALATDHGLVIVGGDGTLTAFHARSGRISWRRELKNSPTSVEVGEHTALAADNAGTVYAIDGDNGKVRWRKTLDYRHPIEHFSGDAFYQPQQNGTLRALRADTGAELWSVLPGEGRRRYQPPSTLGVEGRTLWVDGGDLTLYALDTDDGRVRWSHGGGTSTPARTSSAALGVGGLVLVATSDGYVEALRPPGRRKGNPHTGA